MLYTDPMAASTPATPYTTMSATLNHSSGPLGFVACSHAANTVLKHLSKRISQNLAQTAASFVHALLLGQEWAHLDPKGGRQNESERHQSQRTHQPATEETAGRVSDASILAMVACHLHSDLAT